MNLKKGDRVCITIPRGAPACSGSFGPGWCVGTILTVANNQWDREKPPNWYIEIEKDRVSGRGWKTGYGYWKQGEDGGTVDLVPNPPCSE